MNDFRQRATLALIAVTALVTIGIWATGNLSYAATAMGFIPARLVGLSITPAVPAWLTPFTATLVHANFLHLFFNVLLLLYCGSRIEAMLGAAPLVVLYLVGACAGGGRSIRDRPGVVDRRRLARLAPSVP